MKSLLITTVLMLVSTFANAEKQLDAALAGMDCMTVPGQCSTTVPFVRDKPVSWSITAQTTGNPGLKIGYTDPLSGMYIVLVNTSVHSIDLSNVSSGNFNPPITGMYDVIFTKTNAVKEDTAAIINDLQQVVAVTRQYASEDGADGDYNDSFVILSSNDKVGGG